MENKNLTERMANSGDCGVVRGVAAVSMAFSN